MEEFRKTYSSAQAHVLECYNKIAEKGGTLPEKLNIENLAEAILTVS